MRVGLEVIQNWLRSPTRWMSGAVLRVKLPVVCPSPQLAPHFSLQCNPCPGVHRASRAFPTIPSPIRLIIQVRRAATRILCALVARYPDALPALYRASLSDLLARFEREREDGVKADVFTAVGELLAQVGATADRFAPGDANR